MGPRDLLAIQAGKEAERLIERPVVPAEAYTVYKDQPAQEEPVVEVKKPTRNSTKKVV